MQKQEVHIHANEKPLLTYFPAKQPRSEALTAEKQQLQYHTRRRSQRFQQELVADEKFSNDY